MRQASKTTARARKNKRVATGAIFDARTPITRTGERDYGSEENTALTAFVASLWTELHAADVKPTPKCPHCGRVNARLHQRPNRYHAVPYFRCGACRRLFTRLTGSPLARLRFASKMPAFFALLSQPIPLEEASRRLQVDYAAASNWLMRFRQLIAAHDPDGHWTSLVRLGIKYRPAGECPRCGRGGVKLNGGYSVDQRRLAKCPACLLSWPLQADSSVDCVPLIVVDDLARNAAARRLRSGLDAPDLPRIDVASMKLEPHAPPDQLPKPDLPLAAAERFDFSRPLRSNSPIARRFTEDKTLTRFLKKHVDLALSPSPEPPACPHCGSADTRLTGKMRAALALPQFQCRACARFFTRTTRTPMANMLRKDMLYAILPLLSQHRTLRDAAEALGTKPEIIKSWVQRFREWLLALDPSGDFERRVRLGLKAPAPQIWCPHCREIVVARPHGFKRTRTKTAALIRRRLFRCTVCQGFFDVAVDSL
ncbi:DUF746 domain-containing protein [Burkholderia sp. Ac-20365]|uniref:DUF746 domain-containing protein n=1 Tax=Burkholderia sp. Ac-20365 TaxID=2703897 RepID=UPI00197BE394|nr:DUF746 domain-containing protein [Burkholderia sp. Ac-20365]MBN3761151.1 DUF746 domain-containing protein [Burkholderia sp. Ac-20365]